LLSLVILGSLTACPFISDTPSYLYGEATVESIEIFILESFPVQIHALARGYTPDGCTDIDAIHQERSENSFDIKITTRRPEEASCTLAIREFEENIVLDVVDLRAGVYEVNINGVSDFFELQVDNFIP
jgi:inhibitor of cysteine peptidase